MKDKSLSKTISDLILGSLLGDGSISINKKYINARFSFRHSIIQKDYFFWKVKMLKEISGEKCFWLQGLNTKDGFGTKKYRYQSLALPELTKLFYLTHGNGPRTKKKVRRNWLNKMSELSLLIWWLDDGSLVKNGRQGVFCTDGFTKDEVEIIQQYLKVVWKIETKLSKNKKNQFRLYIKDMDNLERFLKLIIPHLKVRTMLKKVLLLYKDPLLQQRWISVVKQLSCFDEKTILQELNLQKSKLKFYSDKDIVRSI